MPANYKHIFLTANVKAEEYKASPKRGRQPKIPQRDKLHIVQNS